MSVKCIYHDRWCNSIMEARYYGGFDAMGIKWENETRTFRFGPIAYRPDALIDRALIAAVSTNIIRLYIEIKGNMDEASEQKINVFQSRWPILVLHDIPRGRNIVEMMRRCEQKSINFWPRKKFQPYTLYYKNQALASGMPCVDVNGNLRLVTYESCDRDIDLDKTECAYISAAHLDLGRGLEEA